MGYDIISGEDLISGSWDDVDTLLSGSMQLRGYDIVGRQHAAARSGYQHALAQAAAAQQARMGAVLRQQAPTKARRLVLPLASTGSVAAGASVTITARPQTIAFKPIRLVIPATVAPDFTIQDIKVGNKSQLVQSGSLPAEMFTQQGWGVDMDMDTVQTSQDFVLQISNVSGAARNFFAGLLGKSAD